MRRMVVSQLTPQVLRVQLTEVLQLLGKQKICITCFLKGYQIILQSYFKEL